MTGVYRNFVNVLINVFEQAYFDSLSDRKHLHDIEWNSEDDTPSILGEVEVRADAIMGIAKTCLKKEPNNREELIDILLNNSVYSSESIVAWVASEGTSFCDFLRYIESIENLRMGTLSFLEPGSTNNLKQQ